MATARSLEGQYLFFSPEERMRLAIAALARGDLAEKNKLFATCPTHHYRSTDVQYSNRMEAVFIICLTAAADLRAAASKIAAMRYVRRHLLKVVNRLLSDMAEEAFSAGADFGARSVFKAHESGAAAASDGAQAAAFAAASEAQDREFAERLDALRNDVGQSVSHLEKVLHSWMLPIAQSMVNTYEGLGRFTLDKLGVEPLELIDGYLSKEQNEIVYAMLALFGETEPNEEADKYEEAIYRYWQSRVSEH